MRNYIVTMQIEVAVKAESEAEAENIAENACNNIDDFDCELNRTEVLFVNELEPDCEED